MPTKALVSILSLTALWALGPWPLPARATPPSATLETDTSDSLPQRTEIEITLARSPAAGERLVIELGPLDVTDLFRRSGGSLVYRADLMPLPAGEAELVISLQSRDGRVSELLRQPVRVRTRHGLDAFEMRPAVDFEGSARAQSGDSADGGGRLDLEQASGQFRLETTSRRSAWRLSSEISMLGVSEQENALRFSEKGEQADLFDLASYRLRLEKDHGSGEAPYVELGHSSFGDQRHLVNNVASRGLLAGLPLGSRSKLELYAAGGSQIVGFTNITGLSRSEHRILAGTLELAPIGANSEALELQLSYLDGSLLPISSFNQGVVDDAEESRGLAVRLRGSPGRRLSFDVGYSNSEHDNPEDPLLSQGESLVGVDSEDRDAWFAELDVVLLRRSPEEGWSQDLTLSLSRERVEPLYRSTAAFVQADVEQSRVTLNGSSGPIVYTASHYSAEDNLDDIASILETRTRGRSFHLALPFSRIVRDASRPFWLPTWVLSSERTRQFGVSVPENGDFSESHVPDQVSTSSKTGLEWQGNGWRFGYELSLSDQDNRQPGRENDDFEQLNHALHLDVTPAPRLDLGFQLSRERAEALAQRETVRTERPAFNFSWRISERLQWSGSYSLTDTESATSDGESRLTTVEGGYRLSFRNQGEHGMGGQVFLRYSDEEIQQTDTVFELSFERRDWTVQLGLNLNFY